MFILYMNPYDCYEVHHKTFEKKIYNKDYAYVYLLMKSTDLFESYLIATLVSAYALKKQKTKNKIVILLTPDVDKKYYEIIRQIFDKIYVTEYFIPSEKFMKNIVNDRWKYLYTKINLFRLIQYKKIVFINANLLPIKNCDYLFNYNAPASVLAFNYDEFFDYTKKHIEDNYIKKYKTMCDIKNIDDINDKDFFKYGNTNNVMMSSLLVFEPNMDTYKTLKNILNGKNNKYKDLVFTNDEFFFTYFFRKEWTFIDQRFNSMFFVKRYPYLKHIFILNYQSGKPFLLTSKKKFSKYPEYKLWQEYKNNMLNEFSKLKKLINNL
jgi:alpha-N-acetylglucosamine transferase